MAHEYIPGQDWNARWGEFVQEPLDKGQYPIAAGGVGAYGVARTMDAIARFLINHHLTNQIGNVRPPTPQEDAANTSREYWEKIAEQQMQNQKFGGSISDRLRHPAREGQY